MEFEKFARFLINSRLHAFSACSFGWLVACAALFREKSTAGLLLMAGLF
jgi:hypothetical protein